MIRFLVPIGSLAYIFGSFLLAVLYPQSVLAFLLFEASLLLLYYLPAQAKVKLTLAALVLIVLMPLLGTINGYYLEVAIQIGIYAALALGLNIVVGFVGLLNLGFVAFYAIGAYLWAIFGSPQANAFIAGGGFPLAPYWFFIFLVLSIGVGALTGLVLGLPVLRLRGDYLAVVTLGFAEVVRALVNNLDKPVNLTNGPRGISPIVKPPLFFRPVLGFLGWQITDAKLYPVYFYFLVLLLVCVIILVTRRLEGSRIGRAARGSLHPDPGIDVGDDESMPRLHPGRPGRGLSAGVVPCRRRADARQSRSRWLHRGHCNRRSKPGY